VERGGGDIVYVKDLDVVKTPMSGTIKGVGVPEN
jgi:hypothetical protein